MTKGTFFALAEFRAGTESASQAAFLVSHMVSACCLAVLQSSTDWQQDKRYATVYVCEKGFVAFFPPFFNVTRWSSSARTQGSFCKRYFIWIPKERSQQTGSERYCVHVCVITLSNFRFTVQEKCLLQLQDEILLLDHAKGSCTINFTAASPSPLPEALFF